MRAPPARLQFRSLARSAGCPILAPSASVDVLSHVAQVFRPEAFFFRVPVLSPHAARFLLAFCVAMPSIEKTRVPSLFTSHSSLATASPSGAFVHARHVCAMCSPSNDGHSDRSGRALLLFVSRCMRHARLRSGGISLGCYSRLELHSEEVAFAGAGPFFGRAPLPYWREIQACHSSLATAIPLPYLLERVSVTASPSCAASSFLTEQANPCCSNREAIAFEISS